MILKRYLLARCSRSQPKGASPRAYSSDTPDPTIPELTDETLKTAKELSSSQRLSDVEAEKILIVTFRTVASSICHKHH